MPVHNYEVVLDCTTDDVSVAVAEGFRRALGGKVIMPRYVARVISRLGLPVPAEHDADEEPNSIRDETTRLAEAMDGRRIGTDAQLCVHGLDITLSKDPAGISLVLGVECEGRTELHRTFQLFSAVLPYAQQKTRTVLLHILDCLSPASPET
jgi:hypothetical protein